MANNAQRWAAGVTLAGGAAVAAAMIGAAGMPAARADSIDDPLTQAEGNFNDAATRYSGIDASLLPAHQAANIGVEVSDLHNQADLVSQIQSQQDGLSETLQTNPQLAAADNQLATASGDLLSAVNASVNAADAGDYATGATLSGEVTGYFDRLNLAGTEIFQVLPAELNAEFTTLFVGFPKVEPITVPAGIATGADSTALASSVTGTTPAGLLSDATTNYIDANHLLSELPASSFGQYAPALATAIQFDDSTLQNIANVGSAEAALSSYDNGALSELLTPLFTSVNQSWDQASEAALAADQAVGNVVGSGSTADITAAMIGISGPEYDAIGSTIQSEFIDLGAHFLTGGDFTSIGDLASGFDPASAIDPSMFADLSSSIGL
ncbi:hypothetical protein NM962_19290 [Mycobacterium sp. SVM_VP21]|nr:hypothetical protein NM962_19290 [Mycobacterium sp. SVM_VP21]